MKTILFCLLSCAVLIIACNQQNKSTNNETPAASHDEKEAFKNIKVDNTNDLVCGMSLTAGIGDTAHYNGKVYGFCSTGCKDKFVKKPADYIAAQ
jgi:YHS domain-containing protein